jgi:hypothetical protein
MRIALLLAGLSGAFLASAPVAQAADPVTAEALFLEGRRDADAGLYVLACAKFEESNHLDPAPGALLNLADCEEKRGQLARAWQHFRQLDDDLPASDERRPIAESRALILERRTPRLRVVLTSGPMATVKRDDTVLGLASLGASQPVDPGRHVVVVSSPGRRDQRYDVELAEGQRKELSVAPGEPLPPVETPSPGKIGTVPGEAVDAVPEPAHREGGPEHTAAWVLGGFGAASLVTGGVFGVTALAQLASSNAHCTGNVCASQDGINQFHTAQSFALVADITMGVGLACIGTAIVLAVAGRHGSHPGAEASLPMWLQGRF